MTDVLQDISIICIAIACILNSIAVARAAHR